MLASIALALSGGAQVAAGIVASYFWQFAFLLVTTLSMATGTWLTIRPTQPSNTINQPLHNLLKKLVDYSKRGQDSIAAPTGQRNNRIAKAHERSPNRGQRAADRVVDLVLLEGGRLMSRGPVVDALGPERRPDVLGREAPRTEVTGNGKAADVL